MLHIGIGQIGEYDMWSEITISLTRNLPLLFVVHPHCEILGVIYPVSLYTSGMSALFQPPSRSSRFRTELEHEFLDTDTII